MRGSDLQTDRMFCYSSPETFVPPDHPLRPIRAMVEKALSDLHSEYPSTFSQNQERLLASEVAKKFFEKVLAQARSAKLLSDEHFTVDGTLIEAWADAAINGTLPV